MVFSKQFHIFQKKNIFLNNLTFWGDNSLEIGNIQSKSLCIESNFMLNQLNYGKCNYKCCICLEMPWELCYILDRSHLIGLSFSSCASWPRPCKDERKEDMDFS